MEKMGRIIGLGNSAVFDSFGFLPQDIVLNKIPGLPVSLPLGDWTVLGMLTFLV